MIPRIYKLEDDLEQSVFLFGARQTGKSTYLKTVFPNAVYIDLLDSKQKRHFTHQPEMLYDMLQDKPANQIVIIDEIAEVPSLLNEVHRLIQEKQLRFILCGSSARKLKRKGYNTLGGRAFPCYFYPFVSAELPNLDLNKALLYGMLPPCYLSNKPWNVLSSYIDVYIKEEIKEEALVRNLDNFQHFLDVTAIGNADIVNYANIASDCGVTAKTVKEYYNILEDTLLGFMVPAYTKVLKRKVVQAPKFYYFDVGVYNYLMQRESLAPNSSEYGHCFEHFVMQELNAYIGYTHNRKKLSYWHTYEGKEIDAVLGEAEVGIEIKSTEEIQPKHYVNFKEYKEEFPNSRCIVVSRDPFTRRTGDIENMSIFDFLQKLWKGEII